MSQANAKRGGIIKKVAIMTNPILSTVKQFSEKQPAFTIGGLRSLIFNEHSNGLAKSGAIIRIGRKILIDNDKFFAWVESKNQKAVA